MLLGVPGPAPGACLCSQMQLQLLTFVCLMCKDFFILEICNVKSSPLLELLIMDGEVSMNHPSPGPDRDKTG